LLPREFWSEVHGLEAVSLGGADDSPNPKFCCVKMTEENILMETPLTQILPMGCVFSTWLRMARRQQVRAAFIVGNIVDCISSHDWDFALRCVEVPNLKSASSPPAQDNLRRHFKCRYLAQRSVPVSISSNVF
jgi:hypothetical protein